MPTVRYLVKVHSLLAFSLFCGSTFLPLAGQKRLERRSQERRTSLLFLIVDVEYWGREPLCLSPGHRASQPRRPEGSSAKAQTLHSAKALHSSAPGIRQWGRWFLNMLWSSVGRSQPVFQSLLCAWDFDLCLWAQTTYCLCACVRSMPTSGFGGDHLATTVTIPLWQLSLEIGRAHRGRSHLWFADTGGARQAPGAAAVTLLCREHSNDCAISVQGSATRLCTCSLCNIYQQLSFILLFPASHFKTNSSRPFAFTMEHNHQEISQGKKKT